MGKRNDKPRRAMFWELRRVVYLRDDFACRMCGWRVPVDKIPSPPESYTGGRALSGPAEGRDWDRYLKQWVPAWRELQMDHVVPYSKGGTYHPSNIRAACSKCNAARGNKDDVEEVQ